MKFDAIVGNPPYNTDKRHKKDGHITSNVWSRFVAHATVTLLDGGHLIYVHPPIWRKPEHETLKSFQQLGWVKYIRIFSSAEAKNDLGFPVKVDYYHWQKTPSDSGLTTVHCGGRSYTLDLSNVPFIPSGGFREVRKTFSDHIETSVFYNCDYHHYTHGKTGRVVPEKNEEYHSPVLYLYNKNGPVFYYTNFRLPIHFDTPKIIIPMGKFHPILDLNGQLGMCEVAFAIIGSADYLSNVYQALISDRFQKILPHCRWKVMQLDYRLFQYLKRDFWKEFI